MTAPRLDAEQTARLTAAILAFGTAQREWGFSDDPALHQRAEAAGAALWSLIYGELGTPSLP